MTVEEHAGERGGGGSEPVAVVRSRQPKAATDRSVGNEVGRESIFFRSRDPERRWERNKSVYWGTVVNEDRCMGDSAAERGGGKKSEIGVKDTRGRFQGRV